MKKSISMRNPITGAVTTTEVDMTEEEVSQYYLADAAILVTQDEVNRERDRRINTSIEFPIGSGKFYQTRPNDRENIQGAYQLAVGAIAQGAQPGDIHWHQEPTPFGWITADDSIVLMDAFTIVELGLAVFKWKSSHIFAAKELKNSDPIPKNYTDNGYWP